MLVSSMLLNNLKASADHKKMVVIKGMGKDCSSLILSVACDDAMTIKDIKQSIYSAKNIPLEHQVLLFKTEMVWSPFSIYAMKIYKELQDDQTCAAYKIENGTVLQLSLIESTSSLTDNNQK